MINNNKYIKLKKRFVFEPLFSIDKVGFMWCYMYLLGVGWKSVFVFSALCGIIMALIWKNAITYRLQSRKRRRAVAGTALCLSFIPTWKRFTEK